MLRQFHVIHIVVALMLRAVPSSITGLTTHKVIIDYTDIATAQLVQYTTVKDLTIKSRPDQMKKVAYIVVAYGVVLTFNIGEPI